VREEAEQIAGVAERGAREHTRFLRLVVVVVLAVVLLVMTVIVGPYLI